MESQVKTIRFPSGILEFLVHWCTEVRFASFFSGWFITAIVVNSPERKLAKRTSVHWGDASMCPFLVFIRFGQVSFNYVENWSSSRHVHAEQSTHFDQEQVHSVSFFQFFESQLIIFIKVVSVCKPRFDIFVVIYENLKKTVSIFFKILWIRTKTTLSFIWSLYIKGNDTISRPIR